MAPKKDSGKVELELPGNIQLEVEGRNIKVSGEKGTLSKEFRSNFISFNKKDSVLVISTKSNRKKDMACVGSVKSQIQNMIKGVTKGVLYELKIVYSHFPMNVKVAGDSVVIDNFLGEKSPRRAEVLKDVSVEVKGQDVKVSGLDINAVSQTAANIEQTTRIKRLDPRVFQDGIYITVKDGKSVR